MRRFADHWKIPEPVAARVPAGAPGESAACAPPVLASHRGTPVWIHPLAPAANAGAFVTDDGSASFLPDDAIANVQLERYVAADAPGARREALLKRLYYLLKPVLPRPLQIRAQRANARSRLRSIDYPLWPQDDSLRTLLGAFLARVLEEAGLERVPFIGFWPRGAAWAACFTHDVETARGLAATPRMAAVEEALGVRATWFVVPERYAVPAEALEALRGGGHEIGVHGLNHDCKEFATREEFVRRTPLIDAYLKAWGAVGFRSPALYRNPDWIPDLAIRYDSSYMDTAALEPQRGGVSAPFPFHLRDGVVELPITLPMDHHLVNLLRTDVVSGMLSKFSWVVERHGLANFLFHPDYNLEESRLRDYRAIIERVLATPRGWVAPAAEIADWWDRRRASSIRVDGGEISIVGPAARDATVWFAHKEGAGVRIAPG